MEYKIKRLSESESIKTFCAPILLVSLCFTLVACKSTMFALFPYTLIENEGYNANDSSRIGVCFTLINNSLLELESFEVTLRASVLSTVENTFDDELETINTTKEIKSFLESKESRDYTWNLESLIANDSENAIIEIQALYVSKITYTNGKVWEDASGMYSF